MNCGITLVSESVLDYVNAVIFAGFLAERFFVVSILFLQEGFSVNAAHRYIQYRMKAKIKPSRKTCPILVGGVVAHPTASTKPDMKLSLHPAPEHTGCCHQHHND